MTFVIVGARDARRLEESAAAFENAGFTRIDGLDGVHGPPDGDTVLGVSVGAAELLREADRRGLKYVLVHDGEADGELGGTYERAHHRIDAPAREELARRLRGRERPLVTCLAFAYKNGAPSDATLLFDARFLDNPYWVPELRDLTGRDAAVAEFVMKQPSAGRLLDDVEKIVRDLVPLFREKGRTHLLIAFGCTGGRHRSVTLAAELVRRLGAVEGIDVDFVTRDLD